MPVHPQLAPHARGHRILIAARARGRFRPPSSSARQPARRGHHPQRRTRRQFGQVALLRAGAVERAGEQPFRGIAGRIRRDQRVQIIGNPDADRQQLRLAAVAQHVERQHAEQHAAVAQHRDAGFRRAELPPPGQQPVRRLERRRVRTASPQILPIPPQRRQRGGVAAAFRASACSRRAAPASARAGHRGRDSDRSSGPARSVRARRRGRCSGSMVPACRDRRRHLPRILDEETRPAILHHIRERAVREGDHRRAAGQRFHRDERCGFRARLGTSRHRAAASRRRLRAKPTGPRKRRRRSRRGTSSACEIVLMRLVGEDRAADEERDVRRVRRVERDILALLRADPPEHQREIAPREPERAELIHGDAVRHGRQQADARRRRAMLGFGDGVQPGMRPRRRESIRRIPIQRQMQRDEHRCAWRRQVIREIEPMQMNEIRAARPASRVRAHPATPLARAHGRDRRSRRALAASRRALPQPPSRPARSRWSDARAATSARSSAESTCSDPPTASGPAGGERVADAQHGQHASASFARATPARARHAPIVALVMQRAVMRRLRVIVARRGAERLMRGAERRRASRVASRTDPASLACAPAPRDRAGW